MTQLGCPTLVSNTAKFIYESNVLFVYDAKSEEMKTFEDNFGSSRMHPNIFSKVVNDGRDYLTLTRKNILDDEYICYEVTSVANPDYVDPGENQNTLDIKFLTLAGDFNQWNIEGKDSRYVFKNNDSVFSLSNISLTKGTAFKIVANHSWDVSNSSTEYGGFGFDDIQNINNYGALFAKGESGNIIVNDNCIISLTAQVANDVLTLKMQASAQ